MKFKKGTFIVVPNKEYLKGKPSEMQCIYFWLCEHSDDNGRSFPTRQTIADEAGCSLNTADKYLKQLVEEGFITSTQRFKPNSQELTSNIYQVLLLNAPPKKREPTPNSAITGVPNNGVGTNPSINKPNLTTITAEAEPNKDKENIIPAGQIHSGRGKTYIFRVLSIYTDLFRNKYGFSPQVSIPRFGKLLKDLMQTKTEMQIASMMIVFFNWRGMQGNSDYDENKLISATHSFAWFFSTINQYETYLRNVHKLDFDNEEEVKVFVSTNMINLKK